jgi:hypothetical protein
MTAAQLKRKTLGGIPSQLFLSIDFSDTITILNVKSNAPNAMRLSIDSSLVRFETSLLITDFPRLVRAHLSRVSNTLSYEQLGQDLIAQDFAGVILRDFIFKLCAWGGYSGIAGRIINQNTPEHIQAQFIQAHAHMTATAPDVGAALQAINQIKQLSTPSFASKQLRFLYPRVCPVLDQTVSGLGYPFTATGYQAIAADCATIAAALTKRHIENPIARPFGQWFASDVDMALYAYLNGW